MHTTTAFYTNVESFQASPICMPTPLLLLLLSVSLFPVHRNAAEETRSDPIHSLWPRSHLILIRHTLITLRIGMYVKHSPTHSLIDLFTHLSLISPLSFPFFQPPSSVVLRVCGLSIYFQALNAQADDQEMQMQIYPPAAPSLFSSSSTAPSLPLFVLLFLSSLIGWIQST